MCCSLRWMGGIGKTLPAPREGCRLFPKGRAGRIAELMDLVVDFSAEIVPDMVRHGQESGYDVRVKLASRKTLDFLFGGLQSLLGAVRAIRRDGVERVGDREDSGAKRNFLATQATWVARPIPFFLV